MTILKTEQSLNAEIARLAAIDTAEAALKVLADTAFALVYTKKVAIDTAITAVGQAITDEAASQVTLTAAKATLATAKTNVATCRSTLAYAADEDKATAQADLLAKIALQRTAQTAVDVAEAATTAGAKKALAQAYKEFNDAKVASEAYLKK